jgi:multicomponent Na+:H+ antiporter subunit E
MSKSAGRAPAAITLLANLITLTPGTLSIDVSDDRKTLYVHTVNLNDPESFRKSIKEGFERRVQELME